MNELWSVWREIVVTQVVERLLFGVLNELWLNLHPLGFENLDNSEIKPIKFHSQCKLFADLTTYCRQMGHSAICLPQFVHVHMCPHSSITQSIWIRKWINLFLLNCLSQSSPENPYKFCKENRHPCYPHSLCSAAPVSKVSVGFSRVHPSRHSLWSWPYSWPEGPWSA